MGSPIKDLTDWTYQDYLKIGDDKRYEIIGGDTLIVPAPNMKHQDISIKLLLIIANYVENKQLGFVYHPPTDVILSQNNVVQPDILFISKDNAEIIKDNGIIGSPDLLVEIISKSSKYRDTYEKKDLYENFKIKEYWLVDPFSKSIEILRLNDIGKYELYSEGFSEDNDKKIIKSDIIIGLEINLEKIF